MLYFFALLIGLGVLMGGVAYGVISATEPDPAMYATFEEYSLAVDSSTSTASGVSTLAGFAAMGWMARKVAYRWFDVGFMMIPFYGVFWVCRVLWRIAALPGRDWAPRTTA